MATKAKKSAASSAGPKATKIREASVLPKGFTRIESGLTPFWTPGENGHPTTLQGKIERFLVVPSRKKGEDDRPAIVVKNNSDGKSYQVGRSHSIASLFDNKKVKAGTEVFLEFLGIKQLKGKRTMRDINCGFKG